MGSFFLFSFAIQATGATQLVHALKRAGWEGWGWFLAAFAGLFTLLFTTFLTHPGGLWDGIYTGLKYWLDQHGVARGGEPAVFYSVVLIDDRVAGADPRRDRRGRRCGAASSATSRAFLVWDFVALAGRLLVGGREVRLARAAPAAAGDPAGRRRVAGDLGRRAARCAASGSRVRRSRSSTSALSSWWINVDRGANPREMLVSTQSSTQVKDVADQVLALAESRGPGAPPLTRDDRLRRGRDVPLRLVLPPPRRPATSTSSSRTRRRPTPTWS